MLCVHSGRVGAREPDALYSERGYLLSSGCSMKHKSVLCVVVLQWVQNLLAPGVACCCCCCCGCCCCRLLCCGCCVCWVRRKEASTRIAAVRASSSELSLSGASWVRMFSVSPMVKRLFMSLSDGESPRCLSVDTSLRRLSWNWATVLVPCVVVSRILCISSVGRESPKRVCRALIKVSMVVKWWLRIQSAASPVRHLVRVS